MNNEERYQHLLQLSWNMLSLQLTVDNDRNKCTTDRAKLRIAKEKLKQYLKSEKERLDSNQQSLF